MIWSFPTWSSTTGKRRFSAYENVFNALKPTGNFVGETCSPKTPRRYRILFSPRGRNSEITSEQYRAMSLPS